MHGSILNKVVATEMLEERANCNFDQGEMTEWYHSRTVQERFAKDLQLMKEIPGFGNTHKFYEYNAQEI